MKYTIVKSYEIEYAHRIHNQEETFENDNAALCRNIHGHSGKVKIFIESDTLYNGMVIDFTNLKIVKDYIMGYDHSILISKNDPKLEQLRKMSNRVHILKNTTSEEIATVMFNDLKTLLEPIFEKFNPQAKLVKLNFSETNNNAITVEE
jgi:6-pyruvoyl tetrahydropterin synthase/QueD family protein